MRGYYFCAAVMPTRKISIVVCNHNYGAYLAEALDSALRQDYAPLEIIVVDDGSTDHSRQLLEDYADRVTVILGDYGGQLPATNAGYAASSGDLVVFLDSDDVLVPDAIVTLAAGMTDPQVVKASGYLRVMDSQGALRGEHIPHRQSPSGEYRAELIARGPGLYRAAFNSGNIWRRDFLDRVMPLATDMLLGPDGFLNLLAPLFGKVVAIDAVVCHYRVHGNNKGPKARLFNATSLLHICALEDEARYYLSTWIKNTDGPATAQRHWRYPWRRLLMHFCLSRMGGLRPPPGVTELTLSPFTVGETGIAKALCLAPLLLLVQLLPTTPSLALARQLLKLPAE